MSTPTMAPASPVIFVTADGERREARTWPDGSYSCPFCGAAVLSPAGWAESQRLNAECYARDGVPYELVSYPRAMRLVYEITGCPNPACITLLNPVDLATWRARIAAREAEEKQRARNHELAMQGIAESREASARLWAERRGVAEANGQCVACLRASYWETRPHFVRHRDAANCPVARKYAR